MLCYYFLASSSSDGETKIVRIEKKARRANPMIQNVSFSILHHFKILLVLIFHSCIIIVQILDRGTQIYEKRRRWKLFIV